LWSEDELVLVISTPLLGTNLRQCRVNVQMTLSNAFIGQWEVAIVVPTGLSELQKAFFEVNWPEPFTLFPDELEDVSRCIPSFDQMKMERSHFRTDSEYVRWFQYVRKGL
jgi:hypothetical protein